MPNYNYLPGVIVNTLDGGLTAAFAPQDDSILVIGTAGKGVTNSPYQVTDRALAALQFGFSGSLERGIEECATNSDNIVAFRCGTKPMVLKGVGLDTTAALSAPGTVTPTELGTGGTLAAGTYFYKVTAIDSAGETTGSPEASVTTTGATSSVGLAWAAVVGATGYKIYRGTTAGGESVVYTTATNSYDDIGATSTAGTVPLSNTTTGATPGFNITFSDVTADAATRYQVWYKAGVLSVWKDGTLVYSNVTNASVDTADISLSAPATGNNGLELGTGATPTLATSVTVTAALALTGGADTPLPTLVSPVDGTGLTKRQFYIALREALDLLAGIQVQQLYVPDAVFDNPNVAFYVTADSTTAQHNPVTNPDALDWLKVTTDAYGNSVYQWASELTDSAGGVTTAMVAASAAARIAAGFYEVNFGHTLGNFAASLSQLGPKCINFIGTSAPVSTALVNTRKWIGYLPTYDANNHPTKDGAGLLGNPYLTGITSTKLNSLTSDFANGFRLPGLFVTDNGAYDGNVQFDANQNPIDAGAHVHVVGAWAFMSNGWQANYVQNIAGLVCGYCSQLDEKSGLTNKPVPATAIWNPTSPQLDALTEAKINMLRPSKAGSQPKLLHDLTAASNASDYTNLVRQRCMGRIVVTLLNRANNYIGESSLDGLTLASMKTQLDNDLVALQKGGYCTRPKVTITSTNAQQRIGHATLYITAHPADELIQLDANVGVGQ